VVKTLPEPSTWKAVLGFDFDDTLVMKKNPKALDPRFFESIQWIRNTYGAAWGIATGRSLPQLLEGFNQARFPILPDFVVAREREVYFPGQFGRWVPDENWNGRCDRDHVKLFKKSKRVLAKIRDRGEFRYRNEWHSSLH